VTFVGIVSGVGSLPMLVLPRARRALFQRVSKDEC